MNAKTASQINGGNTKYKRIESDFYPTPHEATQALLNFLLADGLQRGRTIWEPACGEGHMVRTLEANGMKVIGTDLRTGEDFLTIPFYPCDWIMTNPPFSLSEQFIHRCIEHNRPFALLLKSQYWHARRRYGLFWRHPPRYVLPLTWRPDFLFGTRGGGAPLMDVLWAVWGEEPAKVTHYVPLLKPEEEQP